MRTVVRRSAAGAAATTALLLSGACSFSFSLGSTGVDGEELAQVVETQLAAEVGQRPESVTCPEDLPARVGAEVRCELDSGDGVYGVTVTATSVEDGDVKFDIVVDETPMR